MALLIIAAIVAFVYWRLYKTNMDVPSSAEQFLPPDSIPFWQEAELAKHYAMQAGNGREFIWRKPE